MVSSQYSARGDRLRRENIHPRLKAWCSVLYDRYTIHGAKQRIARRLKRKDIETAIQSGEIIEDYPDHHYGPACLLLGKTARGKKIHILCSLQEMMDIITVYEPSLIEWEEDLKTRSKK